MEPLRSEGLRARGLPGEPGALVRLARWTRSLGAAPRIPTAALARWERRLREAPASAAAADLRRPLRGGGAEDRGRALAALARRAAPALPGVEAPRALLLADELLRGGLVGPADRRERLAAFALAACAGALAGGAVELLAPDEEDAAAARDAVAAVLGGLGTEELPVRVATVRDAALRELRERGDPAARRGPLGRAAHRLCEPDACASGAPERTLLLDADRALLDEARSQVTLPARRPDGALGVQARRRLGALLAGRAGLAGFTDAPGAVWGELLRELGLVVRLAPGAPPQVPGQLEVIPDEAEPAWLERWCAAGGAAPAVVSPAAAAGASDPGLEELRGRGLRLVPPSELPGALRRLRGEGAAPRVLVLGAGGPPHLDARAAGALGGAGSLERVARLSELDGGGAATAAVALLRRARNAHDAPAFRRAAGALLRWQLARGARLEAGLRRAAARAETRLARSLAFAGPSG